METPLRSSSIIFCIICLCSWIINSQACSIENWLGRHQFGPDCKYICRCVDSMTRCNITTGECPGQCEPGWMGPACQYVNIAYKKPYVIPKEGRRHARDGNVTTCTNAKAENITFNLTQVYPITFMVLNFVCNSTAPGCQIKVKVILQNATEDTGIECFTSADNNTKTELRFQCSQLQHASFVSIRLLGDTSKIVKLCEMQISGGRNFALLHPTNQSSTASSGTSQRGTDGGTNKGVFHASGGTCIMTQTSENPWWRVHLESTYAIRWFRIVNNDNSRWRLNGFQMAIWTALQNSSINRTVIYTENRALNPLAYEIYITDIPPYPLQYAEIAISGNSKKLTLCEVELYGDCPRGMCGLDCTMPCRCKELLHLNTLTGVCPSGCQPGWKWSADRTCSNMCDMHMYGENCSGSCKHCFDGLDCNKVNGTCPDRRCAPGWQGHDCNIECDDYWYGKNCSTSCNQCFNNSLCDKVNGTCTGGLCAPGWQGHDCNQECDNYWYGKNCSTSCNQCFNNSVCDKVNGTCPGGLCAPGWQGHDCNQECDDYWYGENCSTPCNQCFNRSICDKVNGTCPGGLCAPGWQGYDCNRECEDYWYGENCSTPCNQCFNRSICDKVNGTCPGGLCAPGWQDYDCNRECDNYWYGENCSTSCNQCFNNIVCDKVSGTCPGGLCAPGWQGSYCNRECDNYWYGENCSTSCNECFNNSVCDKVNGSCFGRLCAPGWQGHDCNRATPQTFVAAPVRIDTAAVAGGTVGALILLAVIIISGWIYLRRKRGSAAGKSIPLFDRRKTEIKQKEDHTYANVCIEQSSPVVDAGITLTVSKEREPEDNADGIYTNVNGIHVRSEYDIDADVLWEYVQQNLLDTSKLEKEFKMLPSGLKFSTAEAVKPGNIRKNRYKNVYAYDHSRVKLQPVEEGLSDYINACFIQGYRHTNAYIASQGTTKENINDFWQMIWQQDCGKVVMLTNLYEQAEMKCVQYWPDEGTTTFGCISVTVQDTDTFADYTVRTFKVVSTQGQGSKQIKQFHYTAWPDKGVPTVPSSLVQFWMKVKSTDVTGSGPMVVHCSAGIGRTGTFVALDYLADQGNVTKQVNVFNCVKTLREQRVNMVQTKGQYIFLHEIVVEALMLSRTTSSSTEFPTLYSEMLEVDSSKAKSKLMAEFEKMQQECSRDGSKTVSTYSNVDDVETQDDNNYQDDFKGARKSENRSKNRYSNILPADKYRPYLRSGDSNYINAVYIPSFRNNDGFIITQMPLPETVLDFWYLVYEQQIRTIIMMDPVVSNDPEFPKYWPTDKSIYIGEFQIDTETDTAQNGFLANDFRLMKTRKGEHVTIRQFQCQFWPSKKNVPTDITSFLRMFEVVRDWRRQTGDESPILVHCMNGAERSGVYCVLATVLDRLNTEGVVAITPAIKKIRSRRQQIIPSFEQFVFCHEVVIEYLKTFNIYSNFT